MSEALSDAKAKSPKYALNRAMLGELIELLSKEGHQLIGPQREDGTIVLNPITSLEDLPVGLEDEQDSGRYRLKSIAPDDARADSLFQTTVGPQSWRRYLFPPRQTLWKARRNGAGWEIDADAEATPKYAFIGVRSCDLTAIAVQARVYDNGDYTDPGFTARLGAAFIIAVNCTRAADTCFCASMDAGPAAREGYDIALTELAAPGGEVWFVAEAGSRRGADLLEAVGAGPAGAELVAAGEAAVAATARAMTRGIPADAAALLQRNPEHPHWADIAARCLGCANCTMVCPTCFCSTMEDVTSLDGQEAARLRHWDSCFSLDYSYIHGGPVRRDVKSRCRQWMTHKLSSWHEQFGTSGCTGCGRCITWCPVGIDITEEIAAFAKYQTTEIREEA